MYSLKVTVFLKYSMIESIMMMKLGEISNEYIDFYLWWSILDGKLAVPMNMDIVTDITTGEKCSTIPNTFNLILPF